MMVRHTTRRLSMPVEQTTLEGLAITNVRKDTRTTLYEGGPFKGVLDTTIVSGAKIKKCIVGYNN